MHNARIGVAVVGAGYWGRNLVRNLTASDAFDRLEEPAVGECADFGAVVANCDGLFERVRNLCLAFHRYERQDELYSARRQGLLGSDDDRAV